MFVGSFPEISETFILRQITGLLDLGHHVDIYANTRPEPNGPIHPEVQQYGLIERTTYMEGPAESLFWELPAWPWRGETWPPGSETSVPNLFRLGRAIPVLLRCLTATPRLACEMINKKKYGCQAESLSALYRLATLSAAAGQYDILHAHFGPVANSFRFARALWSAPLVVTFHGYDFCAVPREEGPNVYQHLFEAADAVTVNSEYALRKVMKLGCNSQKMRLLHVGLDLEQFAFRDRVRAPGDPIRLLSVGRLVEKKGIEYALRAVARVCAQHPALTYEIIGDGPLRAGLKELAGELGFGDRVRFHGARDSRFIQERMAEAHIFVLPSVTAGDGDQEGTPVSLMEAQAAGLPILSTLHSGIPEAVLDGQSGLLAPERDFKALADKLLHLIAHPEICRAMGTRGRRHIEEHFDLRKLNRDLVKIYEELTAENAKITNKWKNDESSKSIE
jgi:colanic acid/amylovoran biosynthesis glycosyltransferase